MKLILLFFLFTTMSLFGQAVGGGGVPGTTGGGAPSGPAGGSLSGTYPNPVLSSSALTTALGGSSITPAIINNVIYADGVSGAGIGVAQTAYSSSTAYPQCTAVSYSGANYLAVAATTGVAPGTNKLIWYQVPNAYTPTKADCAFYIAASLDNNGAAGQDVRFGAGVHPVCIGLLEPTVTAASMPSVSIHGASEFSTILRQQSGCDLTAVNSGQYVTLEQPPAATQYFFAIFDWENFSVDANYLSAGVVGVYGASGEIMKNLDLLNAKPGSDHYAEWGAAGNYAWTFQATIDNINTDSNIGSGKNAQIATTVAGGVPSFSITSGGTGYSQSQVVAYVTGTSAGNGQACTSMGTTTATVTGGVITAVNSTATGCVAPIYTVIYGNININYSYKFSNMSDSVYVNGLQGGGVGAIACVYTSNITSANKFYNTHSTSCMRAVEELGSNDWFNTQSDSSYLYGFDFEGGGTTSNIYGSMFEWNSQLSIGSSDYYFGTIANPGQNSPYAINIFGDTCLNTPPTGYSHFVSSAGSIDGGTVMPPFVNVTQSIYCSQTRAALTTPANYVGAQYAWSNGYIGNVWNWGMANGSNNTLSLANPIGAGQNQGKYTVLFLNPTAATSSQNYGSPFLGVGSNFWNGASATANVEQSIKFGNGSNPLQEYAFVFGGTPSTGTKEYLFDQQVNLPHLVGSTGAPTVAAGTGAGTSPSLGVVSGSTDLSGYVTLTTGTTPIASAAVLTLTFNVAYTVAPKCLAWPANAATQALVGAAAAQIFPANTSSGLFVLTQGATALGATTAYEWGYTCTQ